MPAECRIDWCASNWIDDARRVVKHFLGFYAKAISHRVDACDLNRDAGRLASVFLQAPSLEQIADAWFRRCLRVAQHIEVELAWRLLVSRQQRCVQLHSSSRPELRNPARENFLDGWHAVVGFRR